MLIQGAHIKAIPSTSIGWEKNGLRAALRKKTEELLIDKKLKITQQGRPKIQLYPELHQRGVVSRAREMPLLCSGETQPGELHSALATTQGHQPVGARGGPQT